VFSPTDGRKNWKDIVTAFCTAFQDVEDATLVLKMVHHSLASFLVKLNSLLEQLWPFKCRVVALQGYMDSVEYEALISATHFYINASKAEGLCLPLMEYMACCKPSIAPCHTSMVDYVDSSSTLIIDSSLEPCMWPHDPRSIFRSMRYRIDWESLVNAYRRSYDIAKNKPDVYRKMAESASSQMNKFSSNIVVKEKLQKFFAQELGV
jgi:glycosyltransferase involved in cell wall biosynthesis